VKIHVFSLIPSNAPLFLGWLTFGVINGSLGIIALLRYLRASHHEGSRGLTAIWDVWIGLFALRRTLAHDERDQPNLLRLRRHLLAAAVALSWWVILGGVIMFLE
jgi:hypothetical protein